MWLAEAMGLWIVVSLAAAPLIGGLFVGTGDQGFLPKRR